MLLNCALVSGFLFVSVVLAELYSENQQPPHLNHVEESIDPTPFVPSIDNQQVAGAEWLEWYDKNAILKYAAGSFTVPGVYGSRQKGFNIMIGLTGYREDESGACAIDVGIEVLTNGNQKPTYIAWGQWYPKDFRRPRRWEFSVEPGDVITAFVEMQNTTNGHVSLYNHVTGSSWFMPLSGDACDVMSSALWVIAPLPYPFTVPDFHAMSFTGIRVGTSATHRIPKEPEDGMMYLWNMKEDDGNITSVSFEEDFVTIRYKS